MTQKTFTRTINIAPEQIYQSFVNRDDLCDWLCYDASLNVAADGYGLLSWYEGVFNHVYLAFNEVAEGKKLAFSWQSGNRDVTQVEVIFNEKNLTLIHSGFTSEEQAQQHEEFWNFRLDNLKSVLETGANLAMTERVIIGIYPGEFNAEVAERLNVPVDYGVHVANVVENFSAQAAGIQINDVIVAVNGQQLNDISIYDVVLGKKPGETVNVSYYRNGVENTVDVKLLGYPIPPIPASFAELHANWEARYEHYNQRMEEFLQGVDEMIASQKPDENSWSIRELIAHFILIERHNLEWFSTYHHGPRRINPFTEDAARINAILKTYPKVTDLVAEWQRVQRETLSIISLFPDSMSERKSYLWWMTFEAHAQPIFFERLLEEVEAVKSHT